MALATSSAKNAISKVVKPVASKLKGVFGKIPSSVKGGAVGGVVGATLAGGGNKNQTPQTPGQGKGETKTPDTAATDVKKNIEKDSKKSQETSPKSGGYESGYGKAKTPGTDLSKSEYKLPAARRHPVSGNKPPANAVTGSGTEYDPWKTAVKKTYVKNSYQPEPFDLVMEHLLSTEQAANADEALYIMSEMDADAIQAIVDQK